MFQESAHSGHDLTFQIVKKAVQHLNRGQTPVITFDQPLFDLAKQIQWTLPEEYSEHKINVMFGGLYIELAAPKTLGDLLNGVVGCRH